MGWYSGVVKTETGEPIKIGKFFVNWCPTTKLGSSIESISPSGRVISILLSVKMEFIEFKLFWKIEWNEIKL